MDLITKSQESDTDTETPLQTHLSKALSLTNGALNRHQPPQEPPQMVVVTYKECLKNHAASLGGVALDGCGEFMPTPAAALSDPTSLKCAACGCHRNFHRRDNHHPPPPQAQQQQPPLLNWSSSPSPSSGQSPNPSSPASPTPQQSVFPTSASHVLLALSTGNNPTSTLHSSLFDDQNPSFLINPHGKKRARTKFTEEQRVKMQSFAEKLGWRMLRGSNEEKMLQDFCNEIGVKRNVFKVWMHNNKHRRDQKNGHGHGHVHGHDDHNNKNIVRNVNEDGKIGFVSFDNSNNSVDKYQIVKNEVQIHGSSTTTATTDGSSPSTS